MKFYFLVFRESVIKAYECDCSRELILLVLLISAIYVFFLFIFSFIECFFLVFLNWLYCQPLLSDV